MNFNAEPLDRPTRDGRVQIAHVPSGASWRVVVTAHKAARVHVHFVDRRTRPCSLPESPCPACADGLSKRFEAYLGCFNLSRQVNQVLALPEGAWVKFKALAGPAADTSLRGGIWSFSRPGNNPRGPLSVEFLMSEPDPASIPRGLHVPEILYRAWQLKAPPDAAAQLTRRE